MQPSSRKGAFQLPTTTTPGAQSLDKILSFSRPHIYFHPFLVNFAMMTLARLAITILLTSLWTSRPSVANFISTVCSAFYGHPIADNCKDLLYATRSVRQGRPVGIAYIDGDRHVFAKPGIPCPSTPSYLAEYWRARLDLPWYRENGKILFSIPCL